MLPAGEDSGDLAFRCGLGVVGCGKRDVLATGVCVAIRRCA